MNATTTVLLAPDKELVKDLVARAEAPVAMTPEELRDAVYDEWAGSARAQTIAEENVRYLTREAGPEWACPECGCGHCEAGVNGPACPEHGTIGECMGERDEFGGFPNSGDCDGYVVSGHACQTCGIVAKF